MKIPVFEVAKILVHNRLEDRIRLFDEYLLSIGINPVFCMEGEE